MNSVRVSGLSESRLVEELKVYFSTPRHGGGRIRKIYYPLLNNDAVIVYEEEDVAAQVVSVEVHDLFGDNVDVIPLPVNVFTEIQAVLDPGVASMIKATQRCEDYLRYSCEVEVVSDDDHNFKLKGDVYQIEMAWKVICLYLEQQRQIHSRMISSTEKPKRGNGKDRIEEENGGYASSNSRARRRQREEESRSSTLQRRATNGEYDSHERAESLRHFGKESEKKYNSNGFEDLERYQSHKYENRVEEKPKITPRRSLKGESLKNDTSRPTTQPGAEYSGNEHKAEIDRIIRQTLEDSANRTKSSSTKSNDSLSRYGAGYIEPVDIPVPSTSAAGNYTVRKELVHDHDYMSLGSRYGEVSSHPFSHNHADSSDDDILRGRGTDRLSDANDTFERFSSLMVSNSPAHNDKEKSSSISKRSNSLKEKASEKASSHKMTTHADMESMNSVLKDTEKLLMQSSFAAEASLSSFAFDVGHVRAKIYHGNIIAVETAGLINAANGSLANGAGVAGAIARAASPTMQQECDAYIKKFGILGTGEVMHTRAGGRLSSKVSHIIHAVGPIWLDGLPDRCTYELTLTYLNVFKYAEKLWLPSITLPCISSGIFGSPLDVSIKCFLDAVQLFVSECKGDYHLREINMVNNDEDGVITTIAILQSLLEAGQDHLMVEAIDRFTRFQEKRNLSSKTFSRTLSGKNSTKDDFHSLEYGKSSALTSTDPGKRRSSSMSRATGKTKSKENDSPRSLDLGASKSKGSGLTTSGRSSGSTLGRSASQPSGERKSRLDSAGSTRSATTASRVAASAGAKNSPRGPPAMKQSLVTSPPNGGAKPKLKTNTSARNVPLKANTLRPGEGSHDAFSPRSDVGNEKPSTSADYVNHDLAMYSLPAELHGGDSDSRYSYCKICVNEVKRPKTLYKCGHTFCTDCIDAYFKKHNNKCATCGTQYNTASSSDGSLSARETIIRSTHPGGTMSHLTRRNLMVPGYEYCEGAIEIHYDIPSGKQGKYDPLPGQSYTGVQHKAYLPNSAEGREVLRLLKQAFKANKVFRISSKGGIEWNITHKTKISSYSTDKSSYPDPLHLRRVKEELSRKGIV